MLSYRLKIHYGVLIILVTLTQSLHAMQFEFKPGVYISSQYTDNFHLTPEKNQEVVGEISPKFLFNAEGNRSKLIADYLYRYRTSYGEQITAHNHIVKGDASLNVVKNYLTFAAMGQTGIRSKSYTNTKLIDQSDLTSDTTQFSATKTEIKFDNYLKNRFDFGASYSYDKSSTDEEAFTDRNTHTVNARVANGKMYNRMQWSFTNQYKEEEVSTLNPHSLYFSKARLGYNVLKNLNLSVTGGYEKLNKTTTNNTHLVEGRILTSSLWWTLNKNLEFKSEYGQRAYGESYLFSVSWADDYTLISASHARESIGNVSALSLTKKLDLIDLKFGFRETLTTHELETMQQLTQSATAQNESVASTAFELVKVDETFRKQRFDAAAILKGIHNNLIFEIYRDNRNYLTDSPQGKEYGGSAKWITTLNKSNKLSFLAAYAKINDEFLNSDDSFRKFEFRYAYILNKNAQTSVRVSTWQRQMSDGLDIENNQLILDLDIQL